MGLRTWMAEFDRHMSKHRVKITDGSDDFGQQEDTVQPEAAEEPAAEDIEALSAALEEATARADHEHDLHLRAVAEFRNFRRREAERQDALRQYASRELVLKLLAIVDDFERALESAGQSHDFEALYEGLGLTVRKLAEMLDAEGVRPIEAVGQQFDPAVHEAVMRVEDSEHPDNMVVAELQKGYTMGSEVIRPSRVSVAVTP